MLYKSVNLLAETAIPFQRQAVWAKRKFFFMNRYSEESFYARELSLEYFFFFFFFAERLKYILEP